MKSDRPSPPCPSALSPRGRIPHSVGKPVAFAAELESKEQVGDLNPPFALLAPLRDPRGYRMQLAHTKLNLFQ